MLHRRSRLPLEDLRCGSSTDLSGWADESLDLIITDPPFEGLLHYSELSDFFYVWLRLALASRYPEQFGGEYSPKILEAVANPARHGDKGSETYQEIDGMLERGVSQAQARGHSGLHFSSQRG